MLNQFLHRIPDWFPSSLELPPNLLGKHGTGAMINHDRTSESSLITSASSFGLFAFLASLSALVACNIRWKFLLPFVFQKDKPRKLPYRKVEAASGDYNKSIVVVLLHGMWNDASYFEELQEYLADGGYTSYAIELLPGERWLPGGLLQELVRDLEYTLQDIPRPHVLLGHSRGGILIQGALQLSPKMRQNSSSTGVILLASYPLGYVPPLRAIFDQRKDGIIHNWMGAMNILLFGKLRNKEYTKRIFLLPTANERSPKIARYLRESVTAPSDGAWYCCWHPSPPPMPDVPALIMGAERDVLVPPCQVKEAFLERFPSASHVVIPHQAHAFRDGGWQISMVEPLIEWLDFRNDSVVANMNDFKKKHPTKDCDWSQRVLDERNSFDAR